MRGRLIVVLGLVLALVLGLAGCSSQQDAPAATVDPNAPNPVAVIEMENGNKINLELLPEYAPNTVANFIELANSGFYDGLVFHRVVAKFVIQTGDASTALGAKTATDYKIKGEMASNGFKQNTLKHVRGIVSMARIGEDYNSGSSQFFITVAEEPSYLDNEYAAFGVVADEDSMAIVEKISNVAVNSQDKPINDQRIKTIRVDTHGAAYSVEKITG